MTDARDLLPDVIDAVRSAGAMLAAEFCRPDGPRFSDHLTAPVDHAIELFLRDRLLGLLHARFVGEEAGVLEAEANGFCWVVDPHDGTRAYLEGRRGSAVSVALLRHGEPVLGVVFAPLSPDRGPDLIAWAEGTRITRNDRAVAIDLRNKGLGTGGVVFLNHGAWQRPVWHGSAVAPGRFVPLPSIAYRLARVAVGDGVGTITLRPVNALDIAAGHALLLAAGGMLVAEDGVPVTYSEQGESRPSACFGGAPDAVATLRGRVWRGSTEPRREARVALAWPRLPDSVALDRAIGAMLGALIGDSTEPRDGRIAGQPGPQGEALLAVARALVAGRAPPSGNGLLRIVPLAIHAMGAEAGADGQAAAGADGPAGAGADGQAAVGIRPVADARSVAAARAAAAGDAARTGADPAPCSAVAEAVAAGLGGAPEADVMRLAEGVPQTAALTGALRGAALGRQGFAPHDALAVLSCRPDAGLGVARPRPEEYWPDDLLDLAEALLSVRPPQETV